LENFSGFTELAYWLAAVFACVLSLLSLALGVSTFFRLARQYGKKSGNLPEKTVGYFLGVSWSGLSFLNLIFSASMIGFINPEPEIILFLLTQITLLFLIAFAILAVIINRRYFLSWRVATAQFIASSIMLFNLASLLNSGSAEEVVLRSILLVVLAFLSHLLTQSVVNEITKKQKVQAATKDIYSANINLKRLDRAKSDFINTASHQLRSPLSVIKGISSLMMEGAYGKITSGVKEAVEKVFISNERLIGLIESLLNVSHLEEGRVDFEFRKIDLNKIAKVSAGGLILQAQNKKLFLNYVPYKKGELLVWVDEQKVIEAISNLVDNAVKYTQKGGVTVEAKKTVDMNRPAPERYRARVEVRDTGIGIKKEEQANLFKKFVRAGEGSKVNVVGTGLGLYVVRKMIEAHKGRIWAESAGEGRGSSFIIELPLNLPHPPEKEFVKRVVMEKDLSPKT